PAAGGAPRAAAAGIVEALGLALELAAGAAPPAAAQAGLRERVGHALTALRALRPLSAPRLTVVDDWHWLDAASAEALGIVLAHGAPGAELVVLTARPGVGGEAPAWPPTVSPVIRLGELPRAHAQALIRARLGPEASDAAVAVTDRRAGGNPLFIEELATALPEVAEMPENVRAVIAARVDRLPKSAKAALQVASVIGPVFRGRLLE